LIIVDVGLWLSVATDSLMTAKGRLDAGTKEVAIN